MEQATTSDGRVIAARGAVVDIACGGAALAPIGDVLVIMAERERRLSPAASPPFCAATCLSALRWD